MDFKFILVDVDGYDVFSITLWTKGETERYKKGHFLIWIFKCVIKLINYLNIKHERKRQLIDELEWEKEAQNRLNEFLQELRISLMDLLEKLIIKTK